MIFKKFWQQSWRAFVFGSVLVAPLPLALACAGTVAPRIYGVDYGKAFETKFPDNIPNAYAGMRLNEQWPFSLDTLNAIADQLSAGQINTNGVKENDIPWRGGLAYESFSQTVSLLRGYAALQGWDPVAEQVELNKTRGGNANLTYLQDADLLTKTNTALRSEFHAQLTDAYLDRAREWVTATGSDPWLRAFEHQIGAFLQFGDLDLSYDSTYIGFNWITHPAIPETPPTQDFFPALESKDLRLYSWNDPVTPGLLKVGLTGANYDAAGKNIVGRLTRLFTMTDRALIYPVIDKAVYEREFIPILRAAFNKFLALFTDTTLSLIQSFPDLKIAPDLISMVKFLQTTGPTIDAARQTALFNQLNNGTHHLLATVAFWKGFDSTLTRRTSPIAAFAATAPLIPRPTETLRQWEYDTNLPGLRDQEDGQPFALINGPMNAYFRLIQVNVIPSTELAQPSPTANPLWVQWPKFPTHGYVCPAFFTNRLTFDDMLAANRLISLRAPS